MHYHKYVEHLSRESPLLFFLGLDSAIAFGGDEGALFDGYKPVGIGLGRGYGIVAERTVTDAYVVFCEDGEDCRYRTEIVVLALFLKVYDFPVCHNGLILPDKCRKI